MEGPLPEEPVSEGINWHHLGAAVVAIAVAIGVLTAVHVASGDKQSPASQSTTTIRAPHSRLYVAPDRSFAVRFPVVPDVATSSVLSVGPTDQLVAATVVSARSRGRDYSVAWATYETGGPTIAAALRARCSVIAQGSRSTVVSVAADVAGHTGHVCRYEARGDNVEDVAVIDGGRIYVLRTQARASGGPNAFATMRASFRLPA
jgi:hypothetical protein